MRIGQLVGFGEKRFSFDLVSRKKPVVEPAQPESVEPFESLILRRMPSEGVAADNAPELPDAVLFQEPDSVEDAPVAAAPVSAAPPQSKPPAWAAEAAIPAPELPTQMTEARAVSPESVIAALIHASGAAAAETAARTEAVAPAFQSPEPAPVKLTPVEPAPVVVPTVVAHEPIAPRAEVAAVVSAADPVEPPKRATSRVRTTFLGFDRAGGRAADVFAKEPEVKANVNRSEFPFGWVVVVDGPGRGTSFAIQDGVSQIGRGDDQMVQLDFGDMGISRTNHAAIAYDDEAQQFFLGHGGKANIVRLNGRPVLSTEPLKNGDTIRIGETTLRFVAFCGEDFVWNKV